MLNILESHHGSYLQLILQDGLKMISKACVFPLTLVSELSSSFLKFILLLLKYVYFYYSDKSFFSDASLIVMQNPECVDSVSSSLFNVVHWYF